MWKKIPRDEMQYENKIIAYVAAESSQFFQNTKQAQGKLNGRTCFSTPTLDSSTFNNHSKIKAQGSKGL